MSRRATLLLLLASAACADPETLDAGFPPDAAPDASVVVDAGPALDASEPLDASPEPDAGPEADAGPRPDGGFRLRGHLGPASEVGRSATHNLRGSLAPSSPNEASGSGFKLKARLTPSARAP